MISLICQLRCEGSAYVQNGGLAYLVMMGARPQAVGYGLTDSPTGLAGWLLVHGGFDKLTYGKEPAQSPTRDDVLDNFTLYWLTNTAASSARIQGGVQRRPDRRRRRQSGGDVRVADHEDRAHHEHERMKQTPPQLMLSETA